MPKKSEEKPEAAATAKEEATEGLRIVPAFTLEEHKDGKTILHPPSIAITWPDAEEAQGWVDRGLATLAPEE